MCTPTHIRSAKVRQIPHPTKFLANNLCPTQTRQHKAIANNKKKRGCPTNEHPPSVLRISTPYRLNIAEDYLKHKHISD